MSGRRLDDPGADAQGLVRSYFVRPRDWHCSRCGARADGSYNSYACATCGELRPLWADSCTMSACAACGEWSLALAEYCEWCGAGKLAIRPGD